MEEEIIKGKSAIVGEWIIRDKHGNIKDQGIDLPTHQEEEGDKVKKSNDNVGK